MNVQSDIFPVRPEYQYNLSGFAFLCVSSASSVVSAY